MSNSQSQLIIDKISKNLINIKFDPKVLDEGKVIFSNKNFMFEQYKLLIDSAHKIEERRGGSNNVFIGINTIIVSVLVNSDNLITANIIRVPLLVSLILIGMLVAWDWLKVTASYKKLNFINYSLIECFEDLLPTFVFSLRAKIEAEGAEEKLKNRANIILKNESLLPKAFLLIYTIVLFTILFRFISTF